MADMPLLIAGLGNPGAQYARNRHNVGFMAVDTIHESYDFGPWRAKFQGYISEGKLKRRKTYLLKPMTYMNDSGDSVGAAARFLKLLPSSVVVLHDEIDLAAGKLKAKTGGGDAGHNGLRSITATLGPDYHRVRIGVGHPGKERVVGHVLQNFAKSDEEWLVPMLSAIAEGAPLFTENDMVGFMNKVALILNPPEHKPKPEDKPKKDETA
jgi:PTH1 family peptidyl-tRNA hydrolase